MTLILTREDFDLLTGSICPPTKVHESYLFQVQEIENSLFHHWMYVLGNPRLLPELMFYREPWRSGFKDWIDEGLNFGMYSQQGENLYNGGNEVKNGSSLKGSYQRQR